MKTVKLLRGEIMVWGFAVVASEIQKLAEESNNSTNQIRTMLEELQANSDQSVADMNKVKDIVLVHIS